MMSLRCRRLLSASPADDEVVIRQICLRDSTGEISKKGKPGPPYLLFVRLHLDARDISMARTSGIPHLLLLNSSFVVKVKNCKSFAREVGIDLTVREFAR
jgi:hypothetical protein